MLQFPLEIMILAPLSRVLSFDSGNLLNLTLQPHFITQVVLSLPNLLEPTAIFFYSFPQRCVQLFLTIL
jgi:hypothetical protein